MDLPFLITIMLFIWNIVVLILYTFDKRKAKNGKRRIPESTLLACTFLFGAASATLGMAIARHKTRHLKFRLLVPLALVLQIGLLVWGILTFTSTYGS